MLLNRSHKCDPPPDPIVYLTDETGQLLTDPEGNLISEG